MSAKLEYFFRPSSKNDELVRIFPFPDNRNRYSFRQSSVFFISGTRSIGEFNVDENKLIRTHSLSCHSIESEENPNPVTLHKDDFFHFLFFLRNDDHQTSDPKKAKTEPLVVITFQGIVLLIDTSDPENSKILGMYRLFPPPPKSKSSKSVETDQVLNFEVKNSKSFFYSTLSMKVVLFTLKMDLSFEISGHSKTVVEENVLSSIIRYHKKVLVIVKNNFATFYKKQDSSWNKIQRTRKEYHITNLKFFNISPKSSSLHFIFYFKLIHEIQFVTAIFSKIEKSEETEGEIEEPEPLLPYKLVLLKKCRKKNVLNFDVLKTKFLIILKKRKIYRLSLWNIYQSTEEGSVEEEEEIRLFGPKNWKSQLREQQVKFRSLKIHQDLVFVIFNTNNFLQIRAIEENISSIKTFKNVVPFSIHSSTLSQFNTLSAPSSSIIKNFLVLPSSFLHKDPKNNDECLLFLVLTHHIQLFIFNKKLKNLEFIETIFCSEFYKIKNFKLLDPKTLRFLVVLNKLKQLFIISPTLKWFPATTEKASQSKNKNCNRFFNPKFKVSDAPFKIEKNAKFYFGEKLNIQNQGDEKNSQIQGYFHITKKLNFAKNFPNRKVHFFGTSLLTFTFYDKINYIYVSDDSGHQEFNLVKLFEKNERIIGMKRIKNHRTKESEKLVFCYTKKRNLYVLRLEEDEVFVVRKITKKELGHQKFLIDFFVYKDEKKGVLRLLTYEKKRMREFEVTEDFKEVKFVKEVSEKNRVIEKIVVGYGGEVRCCIGYEEGIVDGENGVILGGGMEKLKERVSRMRKKKIWGGRGREIVGWSDWRWTGE